MLEPLEPQHVEVDAGGVWQPAYTVPTPGPSEQGQAPDRSWVLLTGEEPTPSSRTSLYLSGPSDLQGHHVLSSLIPQVRHQARAIAISDLYRRLMQRPLCRANTCLLSCSRRPADTCIVGSA